MKHIGLYHANLSGEVRLVPGSPLAPTKILFLVRAIGEPGNEVRGSNANRGRELTPVQFLLPRLPLALGHGPQLRLPLALGHGPQLRTLLDSRFVDSRVRQFYF